MNSFLSFYLFEHSLHEKKIVRSSCDLKKKEPFALCGMTRNAGRRVQLTCSSIEPPRLLARQLPGRWLLASVTFIYTQSGVGTRDKEEPFTLCRFLTRLASRIHIVSAAQTIRASIIWRFSSPKLFSKLLIHVYKFLL